MVKSLKKQEPELDLRRYFTREDADIYGQIHFLSPEAAGDELLPPIECPADWNSEAATALAEAAGASIPARTSAIEENTMPSWLWCRTGEGKGKSSETSAAQIFDRVVGAAAYRGWKKGALTGEAEARAFYDEMHYLLIRRMVGIEPARLAGLGINWAYGLKESATTSSRSGARNIEMRNASIDAILGGKDKNVQKKWRQSLENIKAGKRAHLRFSDIMADWGQQNTRAAAPVLLDLVAFQREDAMLDSEGLRHAVRLTMLLLDLHGIEGSIGYCNLAPFLMAQGLAYDSKQGRATAAALNALISSEAYAASAKLAGLLGPSPSFIADRNLLLRTLRNHHRAVYGDRNDYEKISVLPAPLALEDCPDLALAAAARHGWHQALELAQEFGLRATQPTALFTSAALGVFMECNGQGIEPMPSLLLARQGENENFRREIHPVFERALTKLGYNAHERLALTRHVTGNGTLESAPGINHELLRRKGFDAEALGALEGYLPYVNNIRLAFTPWILGEAFCRRALKVPANKIEDASFDLLRHLGFSSEAIRQANAFCYGHGHASGANILKPEHRHVFDGANDVAPAAQIRMAAAVQSFVAGEVNLILALPAATDMHICGELLLDTWRQGVKSVTVFFEGAMPDNTATARRSLPEILHTQKSGHLPRRKQRVKARASLVGLSRRKPERLSTKDRQG